MWSPHDKCGSRQVKTKAGTFRSAGGGGRRDSSRRGSDAPRAPTWRVLAALCWGGRADCVGVSSPQYLGGPRLKRCAQNGGHAGTAALQAVAGNPEVVCIHHAGGRPSPAAETRADAEATPREPRRGGFWPRCVGVAEPTASVSVHLSISAAHALSAARKMAGTRGRPPSRRLRETRRLCASITLEGGRPRPPRPGPMRN